MGAWWPENAQIWTVYWIQGFHPLYYTKEVYCGTIHVKVPYYGNWDNWTSCSGVGVASSSKACDIFLFICLSGLKVSPFCSRRFSHLSKEGNSRHFSVKSNYSGSYRIVYSNIPTSYSRTSLTQMAIFRRFHPGQRRIRNNEVSRKQQYYLKKKKELIFPFS